MPHNLSTDPRTGQIAMMYVVQEPWHGLGTKLDHPATSAEAIRAAHLDWEVVKQPLFAKTDIGNRRVDDKYVMMRKDQLAGGPIFGIVSSDYTPLQNIEAFDFFDGIVGQKEAIFYTAGALGQGERVWMLAKLPETICVIGDDICDKYLLLSNSHDGKSSVQIKFTPIRVVCQNTLTLALNQGVSVRLAHTRNLPERLRSAKELLGIIHTRYGEIAQDFQAMTKVKMDKEKEQQFFKLVFPDPRDRKDEDALKRVEKNRDIAEGYYRKGVGNFEKGVENTLWAAYNGVTEMIDYHPFSENSEKRLNNIWFGDGYLIKARAYSIAVEKIKTWAV